MKQGLVLDIGGTKIAAARVNHKGELSQRQQIATPRGDAERLQRTLEQLIEPHRQHVDFVGVASTGIVSNGYLTALNPANLGGLAHFPLQACIEGIANVPCVLLNDGQAAAWAEYQTLSIAVNNMMFVTVSTGVGGGIVLNNKLHTGNQGLAGHIGHTLADPHGPMCGCGRRGCVESVASGTAIGAATAAWAEPVTAVEVFRMAKNGQRQAEQIIDDSAAAIAQMVADMTMALDLEMVVIGGSVGLAEGYLDRVRLAQKTLPAIYRAPLQAAHYRQDSGLSGAALWATATL
ncbi:N-acetylmannosamine kinase [Yersinia entomophaga]|uniref:N-acetylmannosamine kinase n=1 Tax=Yersinia entomophaga TaxID=935293 RepID=A0ABN4Q016_YERET|nr:MULTISPECIES: N-acetylmannosamine kinase [Yersinia]ANI31310.1 N-acetylmannosamine kinase [Yersinia entomophaga]OWF90088.1 N-acetylmannosamine kinase [Yersinia entomophaga]